MKQRRGRRPVATELKPFAWPGTPILARVERLNEKYLTGFSDDLDYRARKRAATIPVVLGDLYFRNDGWWEPVVRWVGQRAENLSPGPSPVTATGELSPGHFAVPLLREILIEAHLVARSQPLTARFVFDMSPMVATWIAGFSMDEIDWIATRYAAELKPRWPSNAAFWVSLKGAAMGTDEEALSQVRLHSIQLVGSDPA